jgi:hypothetical protein
MNRWERLAIAAMLFVAATFSALYLPPDYRIQGGGEPRAVAESLLNSGTFANPFAANMNTGPTAHLPPLHPLLISSVMELFGGVWLVYLTVIIHAVHASLLPSASRLLFGRTAPGVWASVTCIILPVFAILPTWDAMYSATGLVLFCLLTSRLVGSNLEIHWKGMLAGIPAAVLTLLNPATFAVALCWILFLTFTSLHRLKRRLYFFLFFLLGVALGCTPWLARNYRVFHRVVLIRDDLGIAIHTSNNDCAQSSLEANLENGCQQAHHPMFSRDEIHLLAQMGEVDYNSDRLATALRWIRTHRYRFATLTYERIIDFWLPPHSRPIWIVTGLSFIGLIIVAIRRLPVAVFLVSALATYPIIYYFVQSTVRYRYPVMWISLLCAGYALARIGEIMAGRWRHVWAIAPAVSK